MAMYGLFLYIIQHQLFYASYSFRLR